MSFSVSAAGSNSLNSLVWATQPLTAEQQEYLNQNYSVGPNNGTVKVVDGLTSWQGDLDVAALGIEPSRVDTLPLITYGPSGKPIQQEPLKLRILTGVTFGDTTQAVPEILKNGVLVPLDSTAASAGVANPPAAAPNVTAAYGTQANTVSTEQTLSSAIKAVARASANNDDFNLLESFFK